jgi:hypothetical protein
MNSVADARRRRQAGQPVRCAPVLRRERLRNELAGTVEALFRRRADLVPEGFIADYVALDWLEWSDGSLRITSTGSDICLQMRAGPA